MMRTRARPSVRRAVTVAAIVGVGLAVATAVLGGLLQSPGTWSAPSVSEVLHSSPTDTGTRRDGPATEADGVLPAGVTVHEDAYAGVANLDRDLLAAVRRAAADAADEGITFHVTSGWRSPTFQDQLLRAAVADHGSAAEAARWVATADTSAHVSGDAIDLGPYEATAWLLDHGADYGLCRTYANEPWHYELRPEAVEDGCPDPYADPTHDPRMHR